MTGQTCARDGCGRPITYVLTETGLRLAIDPDPDPAGNVIRTEHDGRIRAQLLPGDQMPAQQTAWRQHRFTCPGSTDRARLERVAAPRCGICREPLHPLAVEAGWTRHPLCGPPLDFRDQVTAQEATP